MMTREQPQRTSCGGQHGGRGGARKEGRWWGLAADYVRRSGARRARCSGPRTPRPTGFCLSPLLCEMLYVHCWTIDAC
ncbi:hypothetical protein ANCDUO_09471 [Ancylostoma duodenale]|uniref:Uncharacterized protein n=1 Tax=Ancylostoma duodenale TaxID=51022 RepID=A0A0C2GGI7_9BILA|nr:hypothetical protein ANCDUO_09471 [Ancylostoma duodenale]